MMSAVVDVDQVIHCIKLTLSRCCCQASHCTSETQEKLVDSHREFIQLMSRRGSYGGSFFCHFEGGL